MSDSPRLDRLDEELEEAIRALPPAAASSGFRATVLARASGAAGRRRRLRRRLWSISVLAAFVAFSLVAWTSQTARLRSERRAQLLDEHRRLRGELDDLRALTKRRSLIPLGGDAATDLYLDLETIPAAAPAARPTTPIRSQG